MGLLMTYDGSFVKGMTPPDDDDTGFYFQMTDITIKNSDVAPTETHVYSVGVLNTTYSGYIVHTKYSTTDGWEVVSADIYSLAEYDEMVEAINALPATARYIVCSLTDMDNALLAMGYTA